MLSPPLDKWKMTARPVLHGFPALAPLVRRPTAEKGKSGNAEMLKSEIGKSDL
jgi:hypothetical protein